MVNFTSLPLGHFHFPPTNKFQHLLVHHMRRANGTPYDLLPTWMRSGRYRTHDSIPSEYTPLPGEQLIFLCLLIVMIAYLVCVVRQKQQSQCAVEVQMEAIVEQKDE